MIRLPRAGDLKAESWYNPIRVTNLIHSVHVYLVRIMKGASSHKLSRSSALNYGTEEAKDRS